MERGGGGAVQGGGTNSHCWLTAIKIKDGSHFGDGTEKKNISELANGSAFVNEHLTKKNHLTTHMIVSKTPLTPEADNAKFKSYHLGTSVQCNCLSTATTHVKDILPLQKRTSRAIKRSSRTYTAARIGPLCLLLVYHGKEQLIHSACQEIRVCLSLFHEFLFVPGQCIRREELKKVDRVVQRRTFMSSKENKASPSFLFSRDKPGGKKEVLC